MGVSASEEFVAWASVSDLATIVPRMKILPALPVECQVEALRVLWRSLHWVPAKSVLLSLSDSYDRLFIVVRGEVELLLSDSKYIPLLPAGSFFCEAALLARGGGTDRPRTGTAVGGGPWWALTRCKRRKLPQPAVQLVQAFLRRGGPRLAARVQTTQRSLISTLSRQELIRAAELQNCSAALRDLESKPLVCNRMRNITHLNADAQTLTSQDMAALRVVCEGPMNASCQGTVLPACRSLHRSIFGECLCPCTEEASDGGL